MVALRAAATGLSRLGAHGVGYRVGRARAYRGRERSSQGGQDGPSGRWLGRRWLFQDQCPRFRAAREPHPDFSAQVAGRTLTIARLSAFCSSPPCASRAAHRCDCGTGAPAPRTRAASVPRITRARSTDVIIPVYSRSRRKRSLALIACPTLDHESSVTGRGRCHGMIRRWRRRARLRWRPTGASRATQRSEPRLRASVNRALTLNPTHGCRCS